MERLEPKIASWVAKAEERVSQKIEAKISELVMPVAFSTLVVGVLIGVWWGKRCKQQ